MKFLSRIVVALILVGLSQTSFSQACNVMGICDTENVGLVKITSASLVEVASGAPVKCAITYKARVLKAITGELKGQVTFSSPVVLEIDQNYLLAYNRGRDVAAYFNDKQAGEVTLVNGIEVDISSCPKKLKGDFVVWDEIHKVLYDHPETNKRGSWLKIYALDEDLSKFKGTNVTGLLEDDGGLPYVLVAWDELLESMARKNMTTMPDATLP